MALLPPAGFHHYESKSMSGSMEGSMAKGNAHDNMMNGGGANNAGPNVPPAMQP